MASSCVEQVFLVLEQSEAALKFVVQCPEHTGAIYGVQFPYDMQGATNSYFYALYDQLFWTTGQPSFTFIETSDHQLVNIAIERGNALSVEMI